MHRQSVAFDELNNFIYTYMLRPQCVHVFTFSCIQVYTVNLVLYLEALVRSLSMTLYNCCMWNTVKGYRTSVHGACLLSLHYIKTTISH